MLEYAELALNVKDTSQKLLNSEIYLNLIQSSGLHALVIDEKDCLVKTFGHLDNYLNYSNALPDMQLLKMLDPVVALQVGSALRELRRTGQAYRIEQAWSPAILERLHIQLIPSADEHVILIFNMESVNKVVAPEVQNDYQMALHQLGLVQDELQKITMDYHALIKSNEGLKTEKERLDLVVQGTNDGIWDWCDISKESIWWSPRFYELLGYSPKEFQSTRSVFLTILHPEDMKKLRDVIIKHLTSKTPSQVEIRLKTKHDGYRWFLCKGQAIWDTKNKPCRMVGSIADIHEKKQAEEELRASTQFYQLILDSAMAGYWDWRIKENREIYSSHFIRTLGFSPEEVPDDPAWWSHHVHPDDLPIAMDRFQQHVASGGKEPFFTEVRYYRKDGRMVWIYGQGQVIEWDDAGQPLRVVGSHVDITPIKEVEARLAQKNKELEMFAYVTTHDLREPIANLGGLINIFKRKGYITDQNRVIFEKIMESVNKIDQTLHDLIDIACLRKSKGTKIQLVQFKDLFGEVLSLLDTQVKNTQAQISTDFRSVKSMYYIPSHLKSICQNLLSNAIKYRDYGRRLKVRVRTYRDKDFICLQFADNGIGIDAARYGDKVFDIFKRFNIRIEGKGIGLYIVKSQAEYLGGHIEMESEPEVGSTFRVYLPANLSTSHQVHELANGRINVE